MRIKRPNDVNLRLTPEDRRIWAYRGSHNPTIERQRVAAISLANDYHDAEMDRSMKSITNGSTIVEFWTDLIRRHRALGRELQTGSIY